MSVVVAVKQDGKIFMGADTQVTVGSTVRHLTTEHTQKIWIPETPNCIMGCCGLLSDLNLVRYTIPEIIPSDIVSHDDPVDIGTIISYVVPLLFTSIRDYNEVCGKPEDTQLISSFLIGYKDHLFVVSQDGSVEEEEDFAVIGAGDDAALGSLLTTQGEDAETRIVKAIQASAKLNLYVDDPMVLGNNKDCEIAIGYSDDFLNPCE